MAATSVTVESVDPHCVPVETLTFPLAKITPVLCVAVTVDTLLHRVRRRCR